MNYTKFSGFFILALLGALVATMCDGVHVYTKTLSYPKPFLFGQAWWVFPLFVLTFLFMGVAYLFVCNLLPAGIRQKSSSEGTLRDLIETITTFALVYMFSGFGNFEPVLLSVIFYGTFVVRWLFSYDRLWLGGLYMHGAFALREGMRYFVHDSKEAA